LLPAPRGREEEEEKNIRKPAVPTVNTNILKSNVSALNEQIITQNSKDSLSIVAKFSDVTDDSPRLQSVAWKKMADNHSYNHNPKVDQLTRRVTSGLL